MLLLRLLLLLLIVVEVELLLLLAWVLELLRLEGPRGLALLVTLLELPLLLLLLGVEARLGLLLLLAVVGVVELAVHGRWMGGSRARTRAGRPRRSEVRDWGALAVAGSCVSCLEAGRGQYQ